MPSSDEIEVAPLQTDFSGGIHSGISTKGMGGPRATPKIVRDAINARWRPVRGFSIRGGSRDISSVALDQPPTSAGKHYGSSGNKLFIGTTDGAGGGKLYRLTATGRTQQAMDTFTINGHKMSFTMANGLLVMTQQGAAAPPQFYSLQNASDTWLSLNLPAPVAAPTFGTNQAGGSITPTVNYYYRVRPVYTNGCGKPSPVSAAKTVVAASGNYTIRVVIPALGSRTDLIGWVLERNLQDGDATGPFYRVTQQLVAVTQWDDTAADSSLNYESDDDIHLEPPVVDGVIFHKDRLWGWHGNQVYYSQPVIGEESTGLCNWTGDSIALDDDAGDVQGCAKQGDRLLFGKRRSLYVVEGYDVGSFRRRRIYAGVGFAGLRSHVSTGLQVFFYAGDRRTFVANGDAVRQVWGTELRDQLKEMDPTYDADVLGVNYRGEQVLFWHRRKDSNAQQDVLGWDLLMGNAIRDRGLPAIDALSQDGESDFGGADLLVADPVLRAPVVTTSPSQNPSFHVWRDNRTANTQIMIQSLDSLGAPRWSGNGGQGLQVGNSTGNRLLTATVCGDGSGGAYVAFLDNRAATGNDTYLQRFDAAGNVHAGWPSQGVLVKTGTTTGYHGGNGVPSACTDGAGGCFVAWLQGTSAAPWAELRVQRYDGTGTALFAAGGAVLDAAGSWDSVTVVPGVAGQAWVLNPAFSSGTARARLINASGTVVANVTTTMYSEVTPGDLRAVADGAGGIIMAYIVNPPPQASMFVKRIDATGATLWTTNGTTSRTNVTRGVVVPDGAHGCVLGWRDDNGAAHGYRAQRILADGSLAWVAGGVPLDNTPAPGAVERAHGVQDGSGGAIFVWYDSNLGICRAQRVSPIGQVVWGASPVQPLPSSPSNTFPAVMSDAAGGAIATVLYNGTDVRAQRLATADGSTPWGSTGVNVCNATGTQDAIVSCFTDTPETQYPPIATAGYHVWSAFDGHTDFADSAGQNGSAITCEVEPHGYSCGMPNHVKVFQRIENYILKGTGAFSISVIGDGAKVAALSLAVAAQAVKYNSGVKYNDGSKYKTTGESTVYRGLPPNTEGRAPSVRFRGEFTDELEHGGWQLEGYAIPLRRMS